MSVNEARIVGRLAEEPVTRVMPSGDELVSFRVVVDRAVDAVVPRKRVDALECVAWSATMRRRVLGWRPGDVVEVSGAVRRRFFRTASGAASRVEIETTGGRVIRRRRAS